MPGQHRLTTPRARAALPVALLVLLACLAPARAQTVWRMATEYPATNISGLGLTTFARAVADRAGGALTIQPVFDDAAGVTAAALPEAVRTGRLAGGDAFASQLEGLDPVLGLPALPFLARSVAAARALNERARPLYARALAERGLKLLYLTIWPATGLWSDRALRTPDDLRALRTRTYDATSADVMRAAGANAVFLPINEALARVRAHTLNAVLTSGDGGAARGLWDELKHYAPIAYAVPVSIAFVGADAFAALPEPARAAVEAAAAETEASQFALLENRTAENEARMRAHGVTIDAPVPASVMEVLRAAARDSVAAWRARVPAPVAAIAEEAGRERHAP